MNRLQRWWHRLTTGHLPYETLMWNLGETDVYVCMDCGHGKEDRWTSGEYTVTSTTGDLSIESVTCLRCRSTWALSRYTIPGLVEMIVGGPPRWDLSGEPCGGCTRAFERQAVRAWSARDDDTPPFPCLPSG